MYLSAVIFNWKEPKFYVMGKAERGSNKAQKEQS